MRSLESRMTTTLLAQVTAGWKVVPFPEMVMDGRKESERGLGKERSKMLILRFQSCTQVFWEVCGNWIYEPGIQRTGLSWKPIFRVCSFQCIDAI